MNDHLARERFKCPRDYPRGSSYRFRLTSTRNTFAFNNCCATFCPDTLNYLILATPTFYFGVTNSSSRHDHVVTFPFDQRYRSFIAIIYHLDFLSCMCRVENQFNKVWGSNPGHTHVVEGECSRPCPIPTSLMQRH